MRRLACLAAGPALLAAFFSIAAGETRGGGPKEVSLGESFDLGRGQQATISAEYVLIVFTAVLEDSRCPKGEQCIVAGKARVMLDVSVGGSAPASVELGTSEGHAETSVGNFEIVLEELKPYPVSGHSIRPDDYSVGLSIRKLL